jgi:transcriptional regulator with GAF, ATPase, and Fis domain
VDVRVIAATNQDLELAIDERNFRPDLYYRLSVFPIRIPPLRERREDISALAQYFARHFASKLRRNVTGLTDEAIKRLESYAWPGNVRELQNVMERAVILSPETTVEVHALAITPHAPSSTRSSADVVTLADAERQAIEVALEAARWRISGTGGAAELLALKPTTLHAKMKKLGIRRPP